MSIPTYRDLLSDVNLLIVQKKNTFNCSFKYVYIETFVILPRYIIVFRFIIYSISTINKNI